MNNLGKIYFGEFVSKRNVEPKYDDGFRTDLIEIPIRLFNDKYVEWASGSVQKRAYIMSEIESKVIPLARAWVLNLYGSKYGSKQILLIELSVRIENGSNSGIVTVTILIKSFI